MKAKKSYGNGGKYPKGLNKTPKKGLKRSKDDNKKMVDMDRLKKPARPKGLKRMTDEQKRNAPKVDMSRLKKYDNGGKTKKQRLLQQTPTTSGITRVGRPMLQGTRRAAPEKVTPIAAKEIDSGAGASKKLKKSNVSTPVPEKKKKRRLKKYENGGKTKKDSARTDTLERSVEQVYANARRQEEEIAKDRANSNSNSSGTTSRYRNVGRPLTTARPGAPAKVKTLGPKKISSGVSMDKTLKKSSPKISAPAENKRKRRLRRRK